MKHDKDKLKQRIEDVARAFGRPQTGVPALTALVQELTGEILTEPDYKTGQRFYTEGDSYILAQLEHGWAVLINLKTGNRWNAGTRIATRIPLPRRSSSG